MVGEMVSSSKVINFFKTSLIVCIGILQSVITAMGALDVFIKLDRTAVQIFCPRIWRFNRRMPWLSVGFGGEQENSMPLSIYGLRLSLYRTTSASGMN